MIIQRDDQTLTVHTPAKVNLFLEVGAKRPDGFHDVETVLAAVTLYDTLQFRPAAAGTTLECDSAEVGPAADNLVTRTAARVREATGITTGITIQLHKRIPAQAGLGGGSSDAAATLAGLNHFWDLQWDDSRLSREAAALGSDVPFFLLTRSGPAAVGRGRGEAVAPVPLANPLHLVLLKPAAGLATAGVYRALADARQADARQRTATADAAQTSPARTADAALAAMAAGDADALAGHLFNRLEEPAQSLSPAVADLLRRGRGWDCLAVRLSGSGSALFSLCRSADQAERLGEQLRQSDLGSVFVVTTTPEQP